MSAELGFRRWGYINMKQWLHEGWQKTKCTALVARNDLSAIGAIQAFQEAGISVPGEVSVIGFDSTEICDCVSPRVSAVEIPLREISARGVELLVRQIDRGPEDDMNAAPECIILPTRIVQRESTASPQRVSQSAKSAQAVTTREVGRTRSRRDSELSRLLSLMEGVTP
jgi:LacI family transcriptional regulator